MSPCRPLPTRPDRGHTDVMRPRKRSVLLVEDEQSIVEPLAAALAREGFETSVAATAADALELAERTSPDVVLLDLMLPDGSGYDVCRELRRTSRSRSSCSPPAARRPTGSSASSSAPTTMSSSPSVPVSSSPGCAPCCGARRTRRSLLTATSCRRGRSRSISPGGTQPSRDAPLELSRKEFDLLELLAREAGRVVTRERLIEEVWDTTWFGSTKTLDVHVSALRRKLGDDPASPRYLHTVRGVGFRLAGDDDPDGGTL